MRLSRYTEGAKSLRCNPKSVVASAAVVGGYWLLAPSDRRISVALIEPSGLWPEVNSIVVVFGC